MPRDGVPLSCPGDLLSVARFSPRGAQAGKGDGSVRACVIALSKALSTRFIADDYPVDLQDAGVQGTVLVQLTIGMMAGYARPR